MLAVNHHYYWEAAPPGGIYPISRTRLLAEVELPRVKWLPLGQKDFLEPVADPKNAHGLANSFVTTLTMA